MAFTGKKGIMMTLEQHCIESLKMFGGMFEEVHRWLDEYSGCDEYGYLHRVNRHHEAGLRQIIDLFGKKLVLWLGSTSFPI
jgi:hypothetical protein